MWYFCTVFRILKLDLGYKGKQGRRKEKRLEDIPLKLHFINLSPWKNGIILGSFDLNYKILSLPPYPNLQVPIFIFRGTGDSPNRIIIGALERA
jgi:hypothetical protein